MFINQEALKEIECKQAALKEIECTLHSLEFYKQNSVNEEEEAPGIDQIPFRLI